MTTYEYCEATENTIVPFTGAEQIYVRAADSVFAKELTATDQCLPLPMSATDTGDTTSLHIASIQRFRIRRSGGAATISTTTASTTTVLREDIQKRQPSRARPPH